MKSQQGLPGGVTKEEKRAVKEAAREGAREVLKALGIDADNPREVQEDFIFLRQWRKGSNLMKSRILTAAVLTVLSAAFYALSDGIRHAVK